MRLAFITGEAVGPEPPNPAFDEETFLYGYAGRPDD